MAKKHIFMAELVELAVDVPKMVRALEAEISGVVAGMEALENAGLIYATEHWRKDAKGEPKYLYLLHPQKPGEERQREYIGCYAQGIKDARAGIVRGQEYDKLVGQYSALTARVRRIAEALEDARRHLAR